jgi:tetratricopeptide (TPR) repeat protein
MNNLANIYRHQKRYLDAKQLLVAAIKVNPTFPAAWMNLGIVQASLADYEGALASYESALRHRPRYADCHFNLGNLHLKAGRGEAAMDALETAIEQRPRHRAAWSNLVMLADEEGGRSFEDAEDRDGIYQIVIRTLLGLCYLCQQLAH